MKKIAVLFFFFVLFCVSAVVAKEFRVGVLYWSMNIPGQVAMRNGLENELSRINSSAAATGEATVILDARVAGDGNMGIENQINQMNDLIEAAVDLLIVQPTDNAALSGPLRKANSAGIPVIAYDQYISGGTLTAYRTSDNYQAGYLDGEYIASRFAKEKEIQIILVEYPHVSSTVERVNGFLDALNKSEQKYRIVKTYQAIEPVSGKKAGEDILRDFSKKGSVDVVFTVNDGGGLAVVDVLASAGRSEILVATIDGDPLSIENIRAGRLTVIDSAQYCGPLGAETMRAAYSVLRGEKPPYHALVPVFPITTETLERYHGWAGPVAEDFIKPWKSSSPEWQGSLKVVHQ
ncbi:sugar ABC transporter substrate-binding protein [Desulfopila aestuarii]|uniref:Monosaccharide ABC transporter substrate-binding protein, CUT2 family (TC 3.A.1.2.-) n=1 Tax=Desulfopila aestuarii DSM 18488 TaxID=1121416 RepID=A0A1M7YKX8_9BACT|nr:sugar ABC transporter substrate-binding protein [Desulfopila aestuarii]SHO53242.1 monosaccharide ABC transporter substrate-binding protein, CUT2 family (TC 3.A.1.2.-) [Desulfopila aestuarii DSM 18488]